jgi:four helix bundle protein
MTNPTADGSKVRDLKELVTWQVAMDLAVAVYAATRVFPDDEKFGLRLQLQRAAVSIASNIAEGHGRINRREYARFVSIARGSLKECETQLLLIRRLGFVEESIVAPLLELTDRLNRLITGLKRRLRES